MQGKTRGKVEVLAANHNETLVRVPRPAPALKVKTRVKAGGINPQHNETLVRDTPRQRSRWRGGKSASQIPILPLYISSPRGRGVAIDGWCGEDAVRREE